MAECRRFGAKRLEQRDLHPGVGDVIVAADDMGDAHLDIVGDGRQRVEKRAILAHQHWIGERRKIDGLLAAHDIGPGDLGPLGFLRIVGEIRQQEAPVRLASVGFVLRNLLLRQRQRLAAIDRRQAAAAPHLAPEVEFLRRFVAGVEQAGGPELVGRCLVAINTPRLVFGAVLEDSEPMQVVEDGVGKFLAGARLVGVVEALDEAAAVLAGRTSQLNNAVRALPIWMWPVGEGAKRTVTVMRGP